MVRMDLHGTFVLLHRMAELHYNISDTEMKFKLITILFFCREIQQYYIYKYYKYTIKKKYTLKIQARIYVRYMSNKLSWHSQGCSIQSGKVLVCEKVHIILKK